MQLAIFGSAFATLAALEICVVVTRHKFRKEIELPVYMCVFAGLLVARVSYVLRRWGGYGTAPMSVLNILDGGWDVPVGVIGSLMLATGLTIREKRLRVALPLTLCVAGAVYLSGEVFQRALHEGGSESVRLPTVALASLDGQEVRLDSFAGKPTVMNLWASWCGPCRRELPVLQRLQMTHPDINVVFVNTGEPPDTVGQYLRSTRIHAGNVLLDPLEQVRSSFRKTVVPVTLFFDKKGTLTDTRVGELSAGALAAYLSKFSSQ